MIANGFDFFAQDDWQVTPKLNLNLGLRYEYFGPLHSNGADDLGVFIPGKGLVVQGAGVNSIFPPDKNNFAPRAGFAYSVGDGFVVRGGAGVFYDQININPFLDFRPPISAADGLEDNPVGPDAVDSYSRNNYNWQTVQAGRGIDLPRSHDLLGKLRHRSEVPEPDPDFQRILRQSELPHPLFCELQPERAEKSRERGGPAGGVCRQRSPQALGDGEHQSEWRFHSAIPELRLDRTAEQRGNFELQLASGNASLPHVAWLHRPARLHVGACAGRSDRIPRGDSARQLQPAAGVWE